jgi:hypothetical protein
LQAFFSSRASCAARVGTKGRCSRRRSVRALLRGQGLIRGEWLAIDRSKFEAVASRKALLSRERVQREQAEALEARGIEP